MSILEEWECGNAGYRGSRGKSPVHPRTAFLSKLKHSADPGCWIWTGSRGGKGKLPTVSLSIAGKAKNVSARKLSWELLHRATFPEGAVAILTCLNADCVNPDHIEPMTAYGGTGERHAVGELPEDDDENWAEAAAIGSAKLLHAIQRAGFCATHS